MNRGRRPEGDPPPSSLARPQRSLGGLAALPLVMRPVLLVVAIGVAVGYLLRSPLVGAAVAGVILGAILWWRDINLPRRAPPG
jgi:hypothetical protein